MAAESCGSRGASPPPLHPSSGSGGAAVRWRKADAYREVLRRIRGGPTSGARPGFDDELWAHFHSLPARPLYEVIFACDDKPKLLSQLTSLLGELGLNIQEAHAFSTSDGYSLDIFVVDGWKYEVDALRNALRRGVEKIKVIEHLPYDHRADVFSFGIVLWELMTGKLPYEDMTPLQAAVAVVQKDLRPTIPADTHPMLVSLLQKCWHRDPALRPTFVEVLDILHSIKEERRHTCSRHFA